MGDTVQVPAGESTSEYRVTKVAAILSLVATVVGVLGTVLDSLQDALPGVKWVSAALAVVGLLSTVLVALGYQQARKSVKSAALASGNSLREALPAAKAAEEIAK